MKTYKKYKRLKKILNEITNYSLGSDVSNLICTYSIGSSYNEKLYDRCEIYYIPLLFVEFDWNLFEKRINCSHRRKYKNKKGIKLGGWYSKISCPICFCPVVIYYNEDDIIYDGVVTIPLMYGNTKFELNII